MYKSLIIFQIILCTFSAIAEERCSGYRMVEKEIISKAIGVVYVARSDGMYDVGTGTLIADDLVLTSAHVVEYARMHSDEIYFVANEIMVDLGAIRAGYYEKSTAKASVVVSIPDVVAVLKINKELGKTFGKVPITSWSHFKGKNIKERQFSFGYPQACGTGGGVVALRKFQTTIATSGLIAQLRGVDQELNIQTSMGHSGGPVLISPDPEDPLSSWQLVGLAEERCDYLRMKFSSDPVSTMICAVSSDLFLPYIKGLLSP